MVMVTVVTVVIIRKNEEGGPDSVSQNQSQGSHISHSHAHSSRWRARNVHGQPQNPAVTASCLHTSAGWSITTPRARHARAPTQTAPALAPRARGGSCTLPQRGRKESGRKALNQRTTYPGTRHRCSCDLQVFELGRKARRPLGETDRFGYIVAPHHP